MTTTPTLKTTLPPGPKESAFIQLVKWIADPLSLLEKSLQQYGETFTLEFRNFKPFVFLSNPDTIQEILTRDRANFYGGKENYILLPIVGENSILLTDGTVHDRQRKLMFPPFHGDKIRHYGEIMAEITQKVAKKWETGQPFSMRSSMQEVTLEVIMQAVFGISEGDRHSQLKTRLAKTLELTGGSVLRSSLLFLPALQKDFPGSPWRNFLQRQKAINDLLQAEIEQRREEKKSGGKDVLTLLMSTNE